MKSVLAMSIGEAEAEAVRRERLRERGLPLVSLEEHAVERRSPAEIDADDARLEKAIAATADKQLRALGFRVISTSQPRHAKFLTPGIADRLYVHRARGIAFWWEAKSPNGRQSPAQRDFEEDCTACGWAYVVGTDQVLFAWMIDRGIAMRGDDGLLVSAHVLGGGSSND